MTWDATVDDSLEGKDYPEGRVTPRDPESINWYETPAYQPYLSTWKQTMGYSRYLDRNPAAGKETKKQKTKKQ